LTIGNHPHEVEPRVGGTPHAPLGRMAKPHPKPESKQDSARKPEQEGPDAKDARSKQKEYVFPDEFDVRRPAMVDPESGVT
jgi:hypothetical protein